MATVSRSTVLQSPRVPHVVPYQGSKRLLAPAILRILDQRLDGQRPARLWEPFAGSAALTLAAAHADLAKGYVLADGYPALAALWRAVLEAPADLADGYEALWHANDFTSTRRQFHSNPTPERLLYLLTRCVKSAVRFNRHGQFNQAADLRRRGTLPSRMRAQVLAAHGLLAERTTVQAGDAAHTLADAQRGDVAYLDPPWHGTTMGADTRYHSGFAQEALWALVADLHRRGVIVALSYDGTRGDADFRQPPPASLRLVARELPAQRSAQATLLRRTEWTTESLYVSG